MSQFPLGFLGCFNCGQLDHSNTRDYPNNRGVNFDKQMFFRELWTHKPHTKRLDVKGSQFDNQSRGVSYYNRDRNNIFSRYQNQNVNQYQHQHHN